MANPPSATEQLRQFIAKFAPANQKLIRSVRRLLRQRFPTANEMVYDNYNFFVIGYGANERPSDYFLSLAADANGVGICFLYGARLPDPTRILLGAGKQTRFLRVPGLAILKQPAVRDLLTAAAAQARAPLPPSGRGKLIIRSISKKQRPRKSA